MINRSKAYLAPLILESLDTVPFSSIDNTYIFSDFRSLEPTLYIVVRADFKIVDNEFREHLFRHEEVEDIFFLGNSYLLVTNLPSDLHYEYLCFKRGNYSWYRPEIKVRVIKYLLNNVNQRSLGIVDKVRCVFARDPMLKKYYENTLDVMLGEEVELGSKMNEEEETFNSKNCEQFEQISRRIEASS